MSLVYVPTRGPEDWRALLADPEKHWRAGYSAMALARCWEAAAGLPPEIASMFAPVGDRPELLLAIPEHKVPLPGSARGASQNDLFALIRAGDATLAVAVEGKVDEPFDRLLGDWLVDASPGKRERLAFIADTLGLSQPLPRDVHYQLLHRTVSAVIEARRFKTDAAAMIVHSFSPTGKWYDAFERFAAVFGIEAERGRLFPLPPLVGRTTLYIGWAVGEPGFLQPAGSPT